jgi:iron complex outermembrane receptor protein
VPSIRRVQRIVITIFLQSSVAISCAATMVSAETAQADEGRIVLEEVIVTATKRAAVLQDVPVAVSAISAQDMQARGFSQYADYLNTLPGVFFNDVAPGTSEVRVRGIVATGGFGGEVATYFGETLTSARTNGGGKPNLRLVDIDRVELVRGPQGTLFGASALTGVLRIIPAAPNLQEFEADLGTRGFTTAHSSDESYHVEGVVNFPLVEDRLGLRLVGYKDDIAGYIENVVPAQDPIDYSFLLDLLTGQPPGTTPDGTLVVPGNAAFSRGDINSEDTWGARAALTWEVTEQLRFDLSYATQDVTLDSEPEIEPVAGEYEQQRAMDVFEQGKYTEGLDVATLVVEYEWEAASLTSISSFTKMTRTDSTDISYLAELSGLPPIPWALRNDSEGKVFTQEVRLQSRGESPLQWLVGAFYLDQSSDYTQFVPDYSCPPCLPTVLFGQDFALQIAPGGDPRNFNQRQRSVFGEVSYEFSPRWTVGVGGRYLEDELERLNAEYQGFLVGGVLPEEEPVSEKTYEMNPSAYVRFEPTDELTFYLQAARGFRSGVVNQVLSYSPPCDDDAAAIGLGPISDPDTLWNYELGVKSRLADGRLGINAAVFRQEWNDVQLDSNFAGDDGCAFNGTFNAGDVKGEGVEVELTATLASAWRVNLAAAYVHNEFDRLSSGIDYITVGERVAGAPEENVSAGVQYDFSLTDRWDGFARADYVYVGDVHENFGLDDAGQIIIRNQPSYWTGSARLGLQYDNLAVELFGRNLADKRAIVTTGNPAIGERQTILRPREIGLEVRYSFH